MNANEWIGAVVTGFTRKVSSRKFLAVLIYSILRANGVEIPDDVLYAMLAWVGVEGGSDMIRTWRGTPPNNAQG